MKIFPNLAGSLRFYFGLARALTLVFAAFWFLMLTLSPLFRGIVSDEPGLMVSVGEISIQTPTRPLAAMPVRFTSDTAKPGSIIMTELRGPFQADLLTEDPALISALRWTTFPAIAVFVGFSWFLFSALRGLCANVERKEIFSESNLRLVRRIGTIIIGFSLSSLVIQLFAAHVMEDYFLSHVTVTGLTFAQGGGALHFSLLPGGVYPSELGLVTGCVVLMLTAAFRQGLQLKTENDLTV